MPDGRMLQRRRQPLEDGGNATIFVDVTKIKRAEAELAKAKEEIEHTYQRFVDALEAASQGFVVFDAEDRIAFLNSRYRQFFVEGASEEIGNLVRPGTSFF